MYSELFKIKKELDKIVENAYKQGKTDEQVKQIISLYLDESKKRINEENLL